MAKSNRQRRPQAAPSAASRSASAASATTAMRSAIASRAATTTTTTTTGAASKSASKAASGATAKSDVNGSRLAQIRAGAPRPPQNRRRYARKPWWRRNLAALISVAVVIAVVIGFIVHAQTNNSVAAIDIGSPAPQSVLAAMANVSAKTEATIGTGGVQIGFEGTPPNTPVLTSNGLPEYVYVGAEYCPYCAAERWSTIIALDHFGTFKGLTLMKSSSSDVFPNTNTFTFKGATYTSTYLVLNATETEDRNQNQIATPTADALQAFTTFDNAPYTNQQGGIPFVSYGNQYVTTSAPYDPTMLQNLTWQQIAAQLNNPNSSVAQHIIGTANQETAAICKLTNNQPASVCSATYIQQIEAAMPTR